VIIRRNPKANYLALNLSNYSFAVIIGFIGALILGLPIPSFDAMAQALPEGFIASCLIFLPAMVFFFPHRSIRFTSRGWDFDAV